MGPMDYEVMKGLSALCGDDPAALQAMMGAMMGNAAPQFYNQLAGAAPEYYNQLAGLLPQDPQAMLGAMMGAMMGWNPFHRHAHHAHHPAHHPAHPAAGAAALHPIQAINPPIPGVAARGGRVQPLGFENGAFVAGGSSVVVIRAKPERPFRGGRLVGSLARTGPTATGLVTLVSLQVGTDGQLISADPISFDSLSPQAFGVQVDLTPAAVGNSIAATVAVSVLPTAPDRIDFNLTAYGHTMG